VFASVRPRGALLRVHAGKSLRVDEARVGALMEAVEYAAAEPQNSRWVAERLTLADLGAQLGEALRVGDLIPALGPKPQPRRKLPCVSCESLPSGRAVLLPAELVFLPYEGDRRPPLFGSSSNGLASGNSLDEATLHGVFEVLERDAVSMNQPRDASQWVQPDDLPDPIASMASGWRAIGVQLAVRHIPNACALPCFEAYLYEPQSVDVNLSAGIGLHLDREIALARAVSEAAQSRLTCIHGGREDVTDFFAKYDESNREVRHQAEAELIRQIFDDTRRIDFGALPTTSADAVSLSSVLADVLARMAKAGFDAVFRHRFALDLHGLHVVKIVVPRCEDVLHGRRRIGARLFARIVGHA